MCNHIFDYPEDTRENYNSDGLTIMGKCRRCGISQQSYGVRWMLRRYDNLLEQVPYGSSMFRFVDKKDSVLK
jgi:hypothetical protein